MHKEYIVNMRASYFQETASLVQYLVSVKLLYRISVFYQNDSFGMDGYTGVVNALQESSLKPVSTGTYQRLTTDSPQD